MIEYTLTSEEIEWLAEHWVAHNEFCIQHWEEGYIPASLKDKLHLFLTTAPALGDDWHLKYYEFREGWDSAANYEAIAAKRLESGYSEIPLRREWKVDHD